MSRFYLDTDLRQGRIYIAPFKQVEPIYLIEVSNRGTAETLLRQLNFSGLKGPLEAPNLYEIVEVVEEKIGALQGTVTIYKKR